MAGQEALKPDAHEMRAPDLLRSAARLVNRALLQLDTTEAPCAHCRTRLFHNREEARVFEQLADLPRRLEVAALVLAAREGK